MEHEKLQIKADMETQGDYDTSKSESFEKLLSESVLLHGHLCAGQVIGVRMGMLGLKLLGIKEPKGNDRKKLYVFVEIDRCATDAIQSVTGCSLGKRSLFWVDLGIMAATFVNLETGKAVRITALEESRDTARKYCPEVLDKYRQQLEAYKKMNDAELFGVEHVVVDIPQKNMPGKPLKRVQCEQCGEWVQDHRHVMFEGRVLCRGCLEGKYYTVVDTD